MTKGDRSSKLIFSAENFVFQIHQEQWQREGFSVGVTCKISVQNLAIKWKVCHKITLLTGNVCKHLGRKRVRGLCTSSCNSIAPTTVAQHQAQKQPWTGGTAVTSGLTSHQWAPQASPKGPRHSSHLENPHSSTWVCNQLEPCQLCSPAPRAALVGRKCMASLQLHVPYLLREGIMVFC